MYEIYSYVIEDFSQVGEVRRIASNLAAKMGFDESHIAKIAIIATEATNNLMKYATKGRRVIFSARQQSEITEFDFFALDQGPGVGNIAICLEDGYSTSTSPGTGLGAIRRMADQFEIYSMPAVGTVLWAQVRGIFSSAEDRRLKPLDKRLLPFSIGAISLPIKGEIVCGDAWAVAYPASSPATGLFLLVDGLGHGIGAHEAARKATEIFYQNSDQSLLVIFDKIHTGLKKSRGAAMAIAKINLATQELHYVGVGNIIGVIVTGQGEEEKKQNLVSHNGIVGYHLNRSREYSYVFPEDATLIMHSDGLTSRWQNNKNMQLSMRLPGLIAGMLYRDFQRDTDDATILVARKTL